MRQSVRRTGYVLKFGLFENGSDGNLNRLAQLGSKPVRYHDFSTIVETNLRMRALMENDAYDTRLE